MAPARGEQYARHDKVDDRRDQRDGESETELLQRLRVQQAVDRRTRNAERCDEDHPAFEAAREILRLVVTVGMIFVGRTRRNREHDERHTCANEIHDGLERVGKQPHRAGHPVGVRFEAHDDDGRGDRKPREADQ